jgi:glutamate/tyrosine decarboxylase-like PLP-dependent enzyme
VVRWLLRDFATLPDQVVGRTASRAELEALLREPPPEQPEAFARVLEQFQDRVAAYAFRPNHPRFFAFIPSAPTFLSALGDFLCAGTNHFDGVWLEAAGPSEVELVVLDWFKEFLGYPAAACGIITSGGSEANLTALVVAREPLALGDRGRAVLYASEQRHWSVDRAAKIIGWSPEQVCALPVDARFTLRPDALREAVRRDREAGLVPWALVANAGATGSGAVDPLAPLADICREEKLWFHVDAAYGWPVVLIPEGRGMRDGISRSDSVTLDPHKWFGQTFEAGCILVREGARLPGAFAMRPDYMQDVEPARDEINFADYGLALTRRFRALKIWLSVKVLGLGWFRAMVARCCRLADLGQLLLQGSPRFEILCPRQLSVVCFRYVPAGASRFDAAKLDQLNLDIIEGLRKTGRAFLSSTRLGGRVALRFCFVNFRTTAGDVEEVVELLERIGAEVASAHNRA